MKKLLALLLALLMVLSLVACGGEEEETTSRRRNRKSTETTAEETTEETTEETEEVVERDYDSPYTEFETMDVTVIDDEYITVHFGELEKGDWGPTCEVTVTNKTDKAITIFTQGGATNDRMDYTTLYLDVEAGQDATTELITNSDLKVKEVTRLSLGLSVYDSEDYDFSKSYLLDIYPQGKSEHKYDKPDREGEETLVDEDELYFAVTEYQQEDDNFHILFRAINDSQEVLSLSLNPISINGFGCTEYGGVEILPDTYAEDVVWCSSFTDLTQVGMEEVTYLDAEVLVFSEAEDKYILEEVMTLYPQGKSKAEEFVYEYDDDDVVIYEDDKLKLSFVKYYTDEYDYGYALFIMENKSGEYLYAYADILELNGIETDQGMSVESANGLDTYGLVYMDSDVVEKLKGQLTTIKLEMKLYDEEYNVLYEDTLKVKLN